MARLIGPKCKLCRREGMKLFLRGARCDSPKCGVVRREYPPGMHGYRRGKFSDYGIRIREKQRLKRHYGVLEKQFRRYFAEAARGKGNTGETLLKILERRLDNVVYRLGFAVSRAQARQLVAHGHIALNGRKHTIPSTIVRVGDVITPGFKEASAKLSRTGIEVSQGRVIPAWLKLEEEGEQLRAQVVGEPDIAEIKEMLPINEQLIVEICSR